MRNVDDVREVWRLAALGLSTSAIAQRVGVSRATVRAWLAADPESLLALRSTHQLSRCDAAAAVCVHASNVDDRAYAYLLGQYLGDGCISPMRRTFRLRIVCCDAYPEILAECADAVRRVHPGRVGFVQREGCTEVSSYWNHWPCLLPHGSGGVKHRRRIELADWQRARALDTCPDLFVRGLIHSDGWRGTNRVRGANGLPYEYPRYQFSNRSDDIRALFVEACTRLGVATRRMNAYNVSVARRESVAILDRFVGPKR